jgi:DNA segregation ATPase FtsK/SpoIIIE, S-DNA-T family
LAEYAIMPPASRKVNNKSTQTPEKETDSEFVSFLTPDRIVRGAGLFFLFLSIFSLFSFISYIFTWQQDQDEVAKFSWRLIFSREIVLENSLGRLGALFSHVFIFRLFGIGSFILPVLFFTFGANFAFQAKIFPLLKMVLRICFGLVFVPLTAEFLFPEATFPVGGGMGLMLYSWLSTLLGRLGLGILIFGSLLTYLLIRLRIPIRKALVRMKERQEAEQLRTEQVNYGGESIIPDEKPVPVPHFDDPTYEVIQPQPQPAATVTEMAPEPEVYAEPVVDFEPEQEWTTAEKKPKAKKVEEEEDDLLLEVEVHPEEEELTQSQISAGLAPYDHTLELSRYKFPPLDLLDDHGGGEISIDKEDLEQKKNQIVETLMNYSISIEKIKATVGPTVTLYEIVPSAGIRISKIKNLEDDIALSLAALGIRIIAPIPGKGTIGIEVPNIKKAVVSMKSMLASDKFQHADMDLPVAIGKTIANENYIADLAKMPHLLMAGATGQGKSVGLNALLVSLLYKKHPTELKFVLVDPKKVELTLFKKIEKYYLAKLPNEEEAIITDTKKVIHTLNALCIEMDQRYELLKAAMVRNIKEYNQKMRDRKLNPLNGHRYLPYIVLVVDEFADLMMTAGKEVEMPIARLAQLARAIGIHLVIATQRPSVNIITGVIKANFPGRIAFKVASKIDSRTILDAGGADQLIGRGDLLLSLNSDIIRLQCPFVDTPEVERIANFIEDQDLPCETYELPEYIDPKEDNGPADDDWMDDKDPMFEDAARLIVLNQVGSTSLIQRKMSLGYNRAGRLMDQLEAAGIVGSNQGSKAREVLVKSQDELEQILREVGSRH